MHSKEGLIEMEELSLEEQFAKTIHGFIELTKEYKDQPYPAFDVYFVDNILEFVEADDPDYARERESRIKSALGLCYISKNKQIKLLVLKDLDLINLVGTICHEVIHAYDYDLLAKNQGSVNLRELQDDYVFRFWTEFHATYLEYIYLIKVYGLSVKNEMELLDIWRGELKEYLDSNRQLSLEKTTDFCVRLYGKYMALFFVYPQKLLIHPMAFYINRDFLRLYDFLYRHRTFEDIKNSLKELEDIFQDIQKLSVRPDEDIE